MINEFRGEYRWLSNFFPAKVKYNGLDYPTTEHAYQAAKSDDPKVWKQFQELKTPREAQKLGQTIPLPPNWDKKKWSVMFRLNLQKYDNSPELRLKLLSTGDQELIEGNTWGDVYWGVCNGEGRNELGRILMIIRDILRMENTVDES